MSQDEKELGSTDPDVESIKAEIKKLAQKEPGITLWKYMKFKRFKEMVEKKELHLAPLHSFLDVFEGRFADSSEKRVSLKETKWVPRESESLARPETTTEQFPQELLKRAFTKATCFHLNEKESEAMWQNFAPSSQDDFGILIRTSYSIVIASIILQNITEKTLDGHFPKKDWRQDKTKTAEKVFKPAGENTILSLFTSIFSADGSNDLPIDNYAKEPYEKAEESKNYSLRLKKINYNDSTNRQDPGGAENLQFIKRTFFNHEDEYRLSGFLLNDRGPWKVKIDPNMFIEKLILPPFKRFTDAEIHDLQCILPKIDESHRDNKSKILQYSSLENNSGLPVSFS